MKNPAAEKKKLDKATLTAIGNSAQGVYQKVAKKGKPEMKLPIRSLGNVKYSGKSGYFEIGKQKKVRTLTSPRSGTPTTSRRTGATRCSRNRPSRTP